MAGGDKGQGQFGRAAAAGIAGAVTVTLLNEVGKRVLPNPPRLDVMGERALAGTMLAAGTTPPTGRRLFRATLVGDLASNAAYYSLVGVGNPKGAWGRGVLLGAAAGAGAALLPQRIGLGRQPNARTPWTELLTFAWYSVAGLAAAAVAGRGARSRSQLEPNVLDEETMAQAVAESSDSAPNYTMPEAPGSETMVAVNGKHAAEGADAAAH